MGHDNRLVLVDAYAQIYRSFHAIPNLTDSQGTPTNALFGMARFMLRLDGRLEHAFGAVVFDKGKPEKRLAVLPAYKATRPPMPDELQAQLPIIRQWLAAAGWSIIEQDGVEADDLIASIVHDRGGCETYILSGDKDLGQIVADDVFLMTPGKKGGLQCLGPADIEDKFGVPPAAVPDYLALLGDASDNIPGVPGIGKKTAADLIRAFGSIETILESPDAIERTRIREAVQNHRDLIRRNKEIVILITDPPPGWSGVKSLRRKPPDWETLLGIARRHELKSLVKSLEKQRYEVQNPELF